MAVRTALAAHAMQALRINGEAHYPATVIPQFAGQLHALQVFRDERVIGRTNSKLHGEI